MSTSDTPQAGDWINGADGTPLEVREADEGDGQIRLESPDDDAVVWIDHETFKARLAAGEFEPTTAPEAE
jgi:hypothetical protein